MLRRIASVFVIPARYHFWGSLVLMVIVTIVIGRQINDRHSFASAEVHRDVMQRWGAPISQPVPSVRFVGSGAVFTSLSPLPIRKQRVTVDAQMNYRKRGLVYFSGFDFKFHGHYEVTNHEPRDIDVVFVFPVDMQKNKVLLSDLSFTVDGKTADASLPEGADRLVWTGRLRRGQSAKFDVRFRGRGLDSLVYRLDPAAPVKDLDLRINIAGGDNYDYPDGVVPASSVARTDDGFRLHWNFNSLQAGVPIGVILPSEKSFDEMIRTMLRRSWAPFVFFFGGLVFITLAAGRKLRFYEAYLIAAAYAFFFVLLAYFAAFMNFYLAFVLSALLIAGLNWSYLRVLAGKHVANQALALLASFLWVPNAAVVAQGYTGLIYILEILIGLAVLMLLTTRPAFTRLLQTILPSRDGQQEEISHAP